MAAVVVGSSLTATLALAGRLVPLLRRRGFLDVPNSRSLHSTPVPRGGGLAIIAGLAVGLAVASANGASVPPAVLLLATLAVAVSAVADDFRGGVPAFIRLCVHCSAAAAVVWWLSPLGRLPFPAPLDIELGGAAVPLSLLWIVGVTNLYNFLDGIDGYAALQGMIAAVVIAAVGSATPAAGLALAGACAGFLYWNWHPARIFMGDVGSSTIGFLLATLPFTVAVESRGAVLFAVAMALWFFLADGSYTVLRRLTRGERIWTPHRSHLYQRLVQTGLTHRTVALAVLAPAAAIAATAAVAVRLASPRLQWLALAAGIGGFVAYVRWTRTREAAVRQAGRQAADLAHAEPVARRRDAHMPLTPGTALQVLLAVTAQRLLAQRHIFLASVATIHLVLITAANYAAFWLRFDGEIPDSKLQLWAEMLPWLLLARAATFFPLRLHNRRWRYTGLSDLRDITVGVAASTLMFCGIVYGVFDLAGYPRSVFLIDSVLLVFAIGGVRLLPRYWRERSRSAGAKRVLIYGAGDAGEMILRDMKKYPAYHPIGFVDDDRSRRGLRIHGLPVLGTRADLPRIIGQWQPHELLVALDKPDAALVREVVGALGPYKLPITTVPSVRDFLNGKVAVGQIRSLSIEDLLPRSPVGLDTARVRHLITGRRVLVTGAGGSIGSELCRQIAALEPAVLVMFERYENSLYSVANDLADKHLVTSATTVAVSVGDVTDRRRFEGVVAEHRPDVIFHAAAHKHVPLMELNPCEAVKNNVTGTRIVAETAAAAGVERLILISSDKAVNPSSVMGATKRVAELLLQAMAPASRTRFITVRFGNVLASNGSVVPRFLDQIKAGGPVTVTHPEMRRYFMLISEAVQLVLQATALGDGAGAYVLQMGDQIKVVDMARNLIRLSGFVPDEDIPITFVGLRPGEKLSEELATSEEVLQPSEVEKVLRVTAPKPPAPGVLARVLELGELAALGQGDAVLDTLCTIVPSFRAQLPAASTMTAA
jgi:FlaA1/EpsC-like NDP-sugar epimerase/UDP-N-acetylmuramyl pentapeptide phosphotransferase/UDP-N-acetylglucosamine-1-phosphate transferase